VNDAKSAKVMASIPACLLLASNFHEIIRVHVDQYGHIRGLWYQTMATECPKTKRALPSAPVQLVRYLCVGSFVVICAPIPARDRPCASSGGRWKGGGG